MQQCSGGQVESRGRRGTESTSLLVLVLTPRCPITCSVSMSHWTESAVSRSRATQPFGWTCDAAAVARHTRTAHLQ